MNIKAKLFVCGEERELISTSLNYIRLTDWNGKPTSALIGGTFTVTYESQMYDDTFIEWGIADRAENKKIDYPANLYLLRDGKVVFYEDDFDGVELFQYNFQDGTLINYHEVFNNQEGMYVTLTISPAMQDYRFFKNSTDWRRKSRTRYIKPWQESFIPPIKETPYKAQDNTRSKKVLNLYFEDVETKEKVKKVKPDQLVELVIVSKEMKNKKVDIDLNKYPFNFEYNKKPLEKNILKDILITNDTQKLTVKPLKKE